MKETVFSPANVLLPDYAPDSPEWVKWSVIACDQHTSELAYWDEAKALVSDNPSTLGLILPEAYLGTAKENEKKERREGPGSPCVQHWEDRNLCTRKTGGRLPWRRY